MGWPKTQGGARSSLALGWLVDGPLGRLRFSEEGIVCLPTNLFHHKTLFLPTSGHAERKQPKAIIASND